MASFTMARLISGHSEQFSLKCLLDTHRLLESPNKTLKVISEKEDLLSPKDSSSL